MIYYHRDQNDSNAGRLGTTYTYDLMDRPLVTTYPDTGQTSYYYNGDPVPPHITKTVSATPDPSIITDYFYDGLGRISKKELTSDPEGGDYTDTTYDALGRIASVSNPYRGANDPTYGVTGYSYDSLGRTTMVTRQDGSTVQTNYSSFPTITVTDESGRSQERVADALGRLAEVIEPNPSTGSLAAGSYPTYYLYDTLGNLTSVNQVGDGTAPRARSFSYDSLSRPLSATNPETGRICYGTVSGATCNANGYDADSNLIYRTDARGILTTYSYDPLHRLEQKTYTDGTAPASFNYDETSPWGITLGNPIGRLTTAYSGSPFVAGTMFSYDPMGRIVRNDQCGKSNCGTSDYHVIAVYDAAGQMTSLTYPSGRYVTESYSGAARMLGLNFSSYNGTTVNYPYVSVPVGNAPSNWGYSPSGALQIETIGQTINESLAYNKRLQLNQISASGSPQTWLSRTLDFGGANNGNVLHVYDNLDGSRTQTFAYDQLNRITSAATSATNGPDAWSETFAPDPWGNQNQSGNYSFLVNYDSSNRIALAGFGYDAAGDLLTDAVHSYAYDSEARIKSVDSTAATYIYGADGARSRKDVPGDYTEYVYFNGQPIAEKNSAGDWTDYIFANGQRVAKAEALNRDLHIYGTLSGSSQYALFNFPNAGGLNGYTIRTGDTIHLSQFQPTGSKGGIVLSFTDGSSSNWSVKDQAGYYLNDDQTQNASHLRSIDLSGLAGKTISGVMVNQEGDTAAGAWNIYFDYISLTSADGTVVPIYSGETSSQLSVGGHSSGESGLGSKIDTNRGKATIVADVTTYYVADQIGSSRLIFSGNGYPVWSGVFLPYGQEWNPQITMNKYKFTGKERDTESGLDDFGARHYSSTMGRFMQPDPVFFQASMLTDPQRFNLYAYVRNNPLTLIDPKGESIELTGDDEQRKKQLEAAQAAVGKQAGSYLYENKVESTDANGNKTTRYFIGVYTNGPDGKGPAFGSINNASEALGNIISDSRVAQVNLVQSGTAVTNNEGERATIGPIPNGANSPNTTPGATYIGQDGQWHVTLLDTSSTSPGQLPGDYMSNGQPGIVDAGILFGHEFGHVRYEWGGFWRHALDNSNSSAVRLENDVRRTRDPNAATRTQH